MSIYVLAISLCSIDGLGHTGTFFIDGKRDDSGNNWKWASSDAIIETQDFGDGEPNNQLKNENCIALDLNTKKWSDVFCDAILKAICQYP